MCWRVPFTFGRFRISWRWRGCADTTIRRGGERRRESEQLSCTLFSFLSFFAFCSLFFILFLFPSISLNYFFLLFDSKNKKQKKKMFSTHSTFVTEAVSSALYFTLLVHSQFCEGVDVPLYSVISLFFLIYLFYFL